MLKKNLNQMADRVDIQAKLVLWYQFPTFPRVDFTTEVAQTTPKLKYTIQIFVHTSMVRAAAKGFFKWIRIC